MIDVESRLLNLARRHIKAFITLSDHKKQCWFKEVFAIMCFYERFIQQAKANLDDQMQLRMDRQDHFVVTLEIAAGNVTQNA